MLGRRRQSVHGSSGFTRAPSPTKIGPFGRAQTSRESRASPSPQASSTNLRDSSSRDHRLSSLAESPNSPQSPNRQFHGRPPTNGDSGNGESNGSLIAEMIPERPFSQPVNGNTSKELPHLSHAQPPPGPPPHHYKKTISNTPTQLDAEGFSVPAARLDPISMAQLEASDEHEQPGFKLDIKSEPIREEDADAQAALSNVANTLRSSSLATPGRKVGTVRGRRDVRNTMYIPPPDTSDRVAEHSLPASPGLVGGSRAAALAALSSGEPSSSDTQSVRSSRSLGSNAGVKHPDMHQPGLNASIIETVSAYIENGEVKTAAVIGEVALVHGYDESNSISSSGKYPCRV